MRVINKTVMQEIVDGMAEVLKKVPEDFTLNGNNWFEFSFDLLSFHPEVEVARWLKGQLNELEGRNGKSS